ncbi:MerR-like DNA binding protein [Larkinella arboricola]|uniref:MerR-like DNA binding protein n=1 Tax=Larkinella arboricola TaxID=643671 RepID=A0A327WQC4_LARAB|nr:MerR family transcriptional regulator [Larkinella arboricola]RAJ92692.1 MerR-like DNA binding protein [Larkinella arboricola]
MEEFKKYIGRWTQENYLEGFELSEEFLTIVTDKKYTISYLDDQKYHVVNYWDKQGLLLTKRDEVSKWRRFSFAEYVWMHMLQELTEMGVSHQKVVNAIRTAYGIPEEPAHLEDTMTEQEKSYYSTPNDETTHEEFGRLLVSSMLKKSALALRIYKDGTCKEMWGHGEYLFIPDPSRDWDFFIQVSLSEILSKILALGKFDSIMLSHALNKNEAELIEHLHNEELTSVSVQLKKGKPVMFELTSSGQVKDVLRLAEHLIEGRYESISYTTNGGKKAAFKKTTKVRLENE